MAISKFKVKDVNYISTQRVWLGDTLKFNLEAISTRLYRFTAFNSLGQAVESLLVIRSDVGLRWVDITTSSNITASGSYSNGVLTITLPTSSYWIYQLERLDSTF